MRIGYPCVNTSIGCSTNHTFRLKSYSNELLKNTLAENLECLEKILKYNISNNILFFRIGSVLVPFASHPVCRFNWQAHFKNRFAEIGKIIRKNGIRVCMHPDQFIIINSPDEKIFEKSRRELLYQAEVLDLMKLDAGAKIQIHVGGVYKDKRKSIERFVKRYTKLEDKIRKRLVIENDDRHYTLRDCLSINKAVEIPVVFDVFHHQINSSGEPIHKAVALAGKTWKKKDGPPIVDFSTQKAGARAGSHAFKIDMREFAAFLDKSRPHDFDVMLEIKDKEKSAKLAVKMALKDSRFRGVTIHGRPALQH
jgi:UV DNA damage endonuclease